MQETKLSKFDISILFLFPLDVRLLAFWGLNVMLPSIIQYFIILDCY